MTTTTYSHATPTSTTGTVIHRLLATDRDWTVTTLRVLLAVVFFPHGAQKLLGWFGGYGFAGTTGFFTSIGIPYLLAVLVILAESLGAVSLLFGFATRLSAFGIAAIMAYSGVMMHLQNGFFMNWSGSQGGEGIEYHLLALTVSILVMVRGGGALSIDRALSNQHEHS